MKIVKYLIITVGLLSSSLANLALADTNIELSTSRVTDNVYSIIATSYGLPSPENKGWNSNSYFVITENGVLVFDTGSSESIGEGIKKAIKSVTDKPVRWIVNSHSHADHWLGNGGVFEKNTEIIASAETASTMKKYGKQDVAFFNRVTEGATGSSKLLYPTQLLSQGEKRTLGGVNVEFLFSNGGHSSGDMLMWLPEQKIILGGDVLNSDWMPIITPGSNVTSLISTLKTIIDLRPVKVLTGHGKPTSITSLKRDVKLLEHVWQLVKVGYKSGKTIDETLLKVRAKLTENYQPLYQNFDAAIKEQVTMMYKMQA